MDIQTQYVTLCCSSRGYLSVAPELFHRTGPGFESKRISVPPMNGFHRESKWVRWATAWADASRARPH